MFQKINYPSPNLVMQDLAVKTGILCKTRGSFLKLDTIHENHLITLQIVMICKRNEVIKSSECVLSLFLLIYLILYH